jgi:transcriptional regulator with XRE-family HTH domain
MRIPFWVRTQSLLKVNKISQENMARHLGISYNTFRCWLYNNRLPDAQNACEIAKKLGVTVEYLVSGKEKTATERKIKQSEDRKAIYDRISKLIKKLEEEIEHLK